MAQLPLGLRGRTVEWHLRKVFAGSKLIVVLPCNAGRGMRQGNLRARCAARRAIVRLCHL